MNDTAQGLSIPAFPTSDNCYYGLTKREYFAAEALIKALDTK
jgi:hypothetical protein